MSETPPLIEIPAKTDWREQQIAFRDAVAAHFVRCLKCGSSGYVGDPRRWRCPDCKTETSPGYDMISRLNAWQLRQARS